MPDAASFLAAVCAHPDDDGPRLVYADWLEEQGGAAAHARAEFIRLQCRLAAGVCAPRDRRGLLRRERELLARHGGEWAAPLVPYLSTSPAAPVRYGWAFRRGFVEVVDCDAITFAVLGDEMLRLAPIRSARLRP